MKFAIFGAGGRVGKRTAALCLERGYEIIEIENQGDADKACRSDAAIDFSVPQATAEVAAYCKKWLCPLITGVTGRNAEQTELINALSRAVPVIASGNFSEGMEIFRKSLRYLSSIAPEWDREIVETHHRNKRDCPSGTALSIASDLSKGDAVVLGRNGKRGKETAIHSVRCGSVFGTHTVIFAADGETITLTHNAENVDIFASGAINAAVRAANDFKRKKI